MNLMGKTALMTLVIAMSANASEGLVYAPEYYQLQKPMVKEIPLTHNDIRNIESYSTLKVDEDDLTTSVIGTETTTDDAGTVPVDGKVTIDEVGQVIQVLKDLIALGEDFYKLISKGKPTITTNYAPISVVSKDSSGQAIDVMDMEDWSMPKSKKYQVVYKNLFGSEVVKFEYMVIFTYGGSYEGKGAYITGLQIIPSKIKVSFGFDFNATYKLQSIANHGKKNDPVAGAVILLQYSVTNMLNAQESNDTFHVTGKGQIQEYL